MTPAEVRHRGGKDGKAIAAIAREVGAQHLAANEDADRDDRADERRAHASVRVSAGRSVHTIVSDAFGDQPGDLQRA